MSWQEELQELLEAIDEDGTGTIEFREFLNLWEEVSWRFKLKVG